MKRASCGLLYGAMNTTKTTNLGRIARYLYEKYGLTSRLISADNEYDTLEDLIGAGVIDAFSIAAIPNPFPIMTKLSMGEWPVVVAGKLTMQPTPPEQMAKIGAYLIEGTTTIGELLHQDHIRKARKIGEDLVGKFEEDGITFAKSAQSHYGHVQDFVTLDLIPRFSMIPVRWVWWTGHEYAGEDEATGQTRLGPGVVGKAATMKVPRKMGNTFHCVSVENVQTDPRTHKSTRTTEYRAYFEPHADAQLVRLMWPAGVKLPVNSIETWRAKFPEGFIPLTLKNGVEQYLEFHDALANQEALVITPGAAAYPGKSSGEAVPAIPAATSPAPPSAATAAAPAAPASQTRPPVRGYRPPIRTGPPPRPVQPIRQPAPLPTLEDQLKASLEKAKASVPAVEAAIANSTDGSPTELPDINAMPATAQQTEKEGA
jgi:hypothetical protein